MKFEQRNKSFMARTAQIVMGSEESYEGLKESAQKGDADWWSCGKDTKKGDLLFFYFKKPKSEIVALATASDKRRPDNKWGHRVGIKDVELIEPPITLKQMRKAFPNWGWLKRTRNLTYLDETKVSKLLKLANRKGKQTAEPTVRITAAGAGFGTPEQNRVVEKAACKAIYEHFEAIGFKLVSRESEKVGYDFDARRNGEELHIEVKGISGSVRKFIITEKEVKCARTDSKFRLAVVTEATASNRKIKIFKQKEFLKFFELKAIAYSAEDKSGFSS